MAKKKRRKKAARKTQAEPYPGWVWMLFGLAVGLSVAAAIYMSDRNSSRSPEPAAQQPASMETPIETEPAATVAAPEPAAETPAAPVSEEEPRFSFYSMLPNFEIVIPEEENDVARDSPVAVIEQSGTYVLQAGSFTDPVDADRRRAELALLGVESQIQRIAIDERVYHRVRIGPISDLDELNRVRGRLREASIDVLRIRLGD